MNHETPKLRVVGDAAKSAERLREKLVKALGIIDAARREDGEAQAEGKPGTAWRYLSAAVGALRSLLHPEPGTIAWHTEIDYYLDHEPHLRWDASGEYRTPMSALDFVMANPPLDIPPAAEPIDPKAPKLVPGEARHMSYPEASAILMELARNRTMSVDQVNALEMGVRRLLNRHFQRQRNWAKRRAARSVCGDSVAAPHPVPLTPEEELADTIKRQKEEVQA